MAAGEGAGRRPGVALTDSAPQCTAQISRPDGAVLGHSVTTMGTLPVRSGWVEPNIMVSAMIAASAAKTPMATAIVRSIGEVRATAISARRLLGRHSPEMAREGWRLVDDGLAALVASDGHRATRPMLLDGAYELTRARVGEERASPLFDGSALGLSVGTVPERGLSLGPL